MFALYEKERVDAGNHYVFSRAISLFGCNSGLIPMMLRTNLSADASEPHPWHVDVDHALHALDHAGRTIVIDLMPNAKPPKLSLYELVDVWGYSGYGWTPLMFHLRALFVEEDPNAYNKLDFIRLDNEVDDPVFSMTYTPNSTVSKGLLTGKWLPPGPSSTNSVLLWPYAFTYFADRVAQVMACHGL
jgi:hypothetical protein